MWFVRQIGKNRFEASELKSANDLECYDNYIDIKMCNMLICKKSLDFYLYL